MRIFAIITIALAVILFALMLLGTLAEIAEQLERIADAIEKY